MAFLGISALVIVTPGQDTVLTIRNTLLGGRVDGTTAAGVALGQAIWTIAASAGVTALLLASEPAFAAVRIAGAAFLVYLGAQALIAAIRGNVARTAGAEHAAPRLQRMAALRQGLVSNLGNPKMAVFFTSLLPQFVPSGPGAFTGMLGLGLVFCGMTGAWLSAYAFAVARAGDVLGRPKIRRALDGIVGTVLVGFGIRLASQQR